MRRMFSKNQLENQVINLLESGNIPSVKADEIIENMEGYSFLPSTSATNCSLAHIFVGVVKTGNKITFAIAGTISRSDTVENGYQPLGTFTLPKAVADKLINVTLSGVSGLTFKAQFCANTYYDGKEVMVRAVKNSTTDVVVELHSVNNLSANTDYMFRYEDTFLLGENLVG